MSEAAALLNNLSAGMGNTESHITINPDRTIFVPEELRKIAVQYDHNIETVTFDCPRYWDDHDLSQMIIYINYVNAGGQLGCYAVKDAVVDEYEPGFMHFTWILSRNVTANKGVIKFLICAKDVDASGNETLHWNSELNTQMSVSEGLECSEPITEEYPDVITQILTKYGKTLYFNTKAERDDWLTSRPNKMTLNNGDMFIVMEAGVPVCVWDVPREILIELGGGGTAGTPEIYVGTEMPTDENIVLWINPEANPGDPVITAEDGNEVEY